ncbi:hypothetical protein JD844_019652 [Phrynosoma platyrhinos]|uniref:Protein N-lysine methyltransferase FAM173A n=1 Tax=Phrynosoma platyrhinos TaxID=52577 RepID=A0ABQ7TQ98_PHRPL|nr:hypothetical protein JD844_019652 [Phrynosoma platyrhinos]
MHSLRAQRRDEAFHCKARISALGEKYPQPEHGSEGGGREALFPAGAPSAADILSAGRRTSGGDMDPEDAEELAAELHGKTVDGWGLLQIAAGTGLTAYVVWAGILMPGFRKVPLRLQVPYVPASVKQVKNVMSLLKGRSGKMVDLGSGDGRIVSTRTTCLSPNIPMICLIQLEDFLKKLSSNLQQWISVLEGYKQGFRPAIGYELNPWLLRLSRYHAWRAGCYGKVSYHQEDLWKVNLADCKNVTVFLAPSVRKLLMELPEDARVVAGRFPLPTWIPTTTAGEGVNQAWAYDIKTIRETEQDKSEGSSV